MAFGAWPLLLQGGGYNTSQYPPLAAPTLRKRPAFLSAASCFSTARGLMSSCGAMSLADNFGAKRRQASIFSEPVCTITSCIACEQGLQHETNKPGGIGDRVGLAKCLVIVRLPIADHGFNREIGQQRKCGESLAAVR